ncbi:hypothetical protein VBD025_16225 [Virgibacillus flavescens]|uniref:hypothetical protein n=1 Tax=Virgibacillus flavescens TaxID=1611422 RepID=UPI003D33F6F6
MRDTVLTELRVIYYSLLIWFRKPPAELELEQDIFTYHKSSQIKTFVILFSILIVVEGAFFHYLIYQWNYLLAWVFTVLNIYALLYIIGLYNSVKFLPHYIHKDKLVIRLGFQSSVEIDIANIENVARANESEFGVRMPKTTYYALLKIDTPDYEISLKEPVVMKSSYGKSHSVDTVVFRADEPGRMIEGIRGNDAN